MTANEGFRFEVYHAPDGYKFRIKDGLHTIAASDAYKAKTTALAAVDNVKAHAPTALVDDTTVAELR